MPVHRGIIVPVHGGFIIGVTKHGRFQNCWILVVPVTNGVVFFKLVVIDLICDASSRILTLGDWAAKPITLYLEKHGPLFLSVTSMRLSNAQQV
jgi:hypothetical protein